MADRMFKPQTPANGLLHPPTCACVKCAAGRESAELTDALRERVSDMLDDAFIQVAQGNFFATCQALAQGAPIDVARSGFHGSMGNAVVVREMAAAYFAKENAEQE